MTIELQGKVAVVTGGMTGIGRDTAVLFAKAGAKVVVSGRREVEGKETVQLIDAAGGHRLLVRADVAKVAEENDAKNAGEVRASGHRVQ